MRAANVSLLMYREQLPTSYTWQDLKDLIRPEAWHGVWTEMESNPDRQGSGVGFARVKKYEQAINLFSKSGVRFQPGFWLFTLA